MRTKFIRLIMMAFIFTITAQTSQSYNLPPISFANLYRIAADGNLQGLKDVQRRGLNLDSTNMDGDTAVCVAIKRQDYLAYKTLLRAGAKSNPNCVERLPEYAHKNFLANYNQKYAAPKTPINWLKSGTAFAIGGGIAAGVAAAVGSGGGGGGSSGNKSNNSDDASNAENCVLNPCAEGCYENVTCAAGYQCTQYESKCNLGCVKCEQKPECVNVPECTSGCYTNLTCPSGYKCSKYNKCNGCEKCEKVSSGDGADSSNLRNCKDYDSAKNYCKVCNEGYTSFQGSCKLNAPEHCVDYSYLNEKCSACESGYKLEEDKRTCVVDAGGNDASCTAKNYPLTTKPDTSKANYKSCTNNGATRYKITSCKSGYDLSADGKSCVQNSSGGDTDTGTCNAANYPLTTKPDDNSANYTFCIDGTTTRYKITSCKPNYTLAADGKSCTKGGSSGGEETVTCNTTDFPLSECPNGSHCVSCVDTSGKHYKFIECLFGFRRVGDECVEMTESDDNFFNTPKVNDSDLVIDKKNIVTIEGNLYQYGFTNYGGWENVNIFNAYTKDASITVTGDENNNMYGNIIALNAVERIKNSVVAAQSSPAAVNAYKHKGVITVKDWIGQATGISSPGIAYNAMDNGNGSIDISVKPNFKNSQQLGATGIYGNHGVYNAYNTQENGTTTGDINITVNRGGVYQKYGDIHGMELWYSDTQNGYPATIINAFNGGKGNITITINNNEQDGSYAAVGVGMFGSQGHLLANAYGNNSVGNITITSSGISYGNGIDLHGKSTWLGSAYNAYGEGATGYITINGNGNGIIGGEGLDGFHDGRLSNADNGAKGYITINGLGRGMSCGSSDSKYKNNGYCFNGSNGGYGYITINVPENAESFSQEDLPSDFPFKAVGILSGHNGSPSLGVGTIKITNNSDKSVVGVYNGNNYANSTITITSKAKQPEEIDNEKLYGTFGIYRDDDKVSNYGKIDITATGSATAYGIYSKSNVVNKGDITITSANKQGAAYGIYIDGHDKSGIRAENYGNITLTDVNPDTSYGIYAVNGASVYNKGKITINDKSTTENIADGKFIYIDATSQIVNNGFYAQTSAFDTAALGGGKFVLGKDGKITAPEIKGDITADAGITSGGFDKTYSNKNAFSGKTDEVKLNSGSALFDATLKDNDLVMTMKDFDEVVDDKSLAAYLQRNYEAKRNEQLFNSLKLQTTSAGLNSSLNKKLGFSLLPNFAQENMNVFRSLSNLVTDTMFSQDLTNERMMVGYDYLGQDRSTKGHVTGYENTANSSYFLADTKLNNRQRFGLGVALTRFSSDYDDDSSRKATFAQVLGSYMHDFGNRWKYAGLLRAGYADGDYKRQSDRERIEGDTSDILYGFNNELRYNYDLGFMMVEPQLELNAYGYYQRQIKEDEAKADSLQIKSTNNMSVESGVGLYVSKEKVYGSAEGEGETGRVKARLGGSYYRELSQPYHTMSARVRDTDGYYLIESTDIFDRNRVVVRADIAFSWKAVELYFRGSQFMEDKHTTVINAGIKYNF